MTTEARLYHSDLDDKYYFWLGDETRGPYDEYVEAHKALTKLLEETNGKEKSCQACC